MPSQNIHSIMEKKNFVIAIIFGWLHTLEKVNIPQRLMQTKKHLGVVDRRFCGLYHETKRGVWRNGKVIPFLHPSGEDLSPKSGVKVLKPRAAPTPPHGESTKTHSYYSASKRI
jgi:hypothetical protein